MSGDYPTVKRTSAAAAAPALPQSSPFAMGAQLAAQVKAATRRTTRSRIDPAQVEIESGIPLPEMTRPGASTYVVLVKRMKVGDVAWFERKAAVNFTAWLKAQGYEAAHRAGTGKREGQRGVWLLALPAADAAPTTTRAKKGAAK